MNCRPIQSKTGTKEEKKAIAKNQTSTTKKNKACEALLQKEAKKTKEIQAAKKTSCAKTTRSKRTTKAKETYET